MFPHSNSTDYRPLSSSTSSSSSSSSSNPTMEEVWNDFNISSLPNTPFPHHSSPSNFRGVILQDFLNARDPPPPPPPHQQIQQISAVDCTRPPPPPPTILSLNSGPEFQFLERNQLNLQNSHVSSCYPVLGTGVGVGGGGAFDALASSSVLNSFVDSFGKKRFPESDENGSVDRRHKRMIKNRESAARSRARKQAYVQELENEISMLQEEVARLKKQQHQITEAASSAQLPKKHGHHRASTAPF